MANSVDTALLTTFLEVHKARHFGRAAENLYLTQSAVSFRIRQLEELLGVKLFKRYRHNIQLTPEGERLVPHAESILTAWQWAMQEVGLGSDPVLQLALGATPNIWDAFLQNALVRMAPTLKGVVFRADTQSAAGLTRCLLEHTLDLVVLLDPPKVEELAVDKLGWLELGMFANRPGIELEQVEGYGYVMLDWGTAFNIQQAKLFKSPVTPVLNTAQGRIALDFLLEVGGVAFLPLSMAQPFVDQSRLFPVLQAPELKRELFVVYRAQEEKWDAISRVVELLKQQRPVTPPSLQPLLSS